MLHNKVEGNLAIYTGNLDLNWPKFMDGVYVYSNKKPFSDFQEDKAQLKLFQIHKILV